MECGFSTPYQIRKEDVNWLTVGGAHRGAQKNYSTFQISTKIKVKVEVLWLFSIVVCLYLFSTKCQKCLEKYRSNSVSYGLPHKVLILL